MIRYYQKYEVEYTPRAMNKNERCSLCEHYFVNNSCEIVQGHIDPGGWCNRFKAKGGRQAA